MSDTDFTSIKIEVYISSAWVNLTPDVIFPITGFWGVNGTTFMDRVADVGTLKFQLDNSEKNSAGLLGYYTPGHANALSGWRSGLPIRIEYKYDGLTKYDRYYINVDGLQIDSGLYSNRRVSVSCSDWMHYAAEHTIYLLTSQSSKTVPETIPLITANMAIANQKFVYTPGATVFTTVLDISGASTTAQGEFQRLIMSEWGQLARRRNSIDGETLYFSGRAGGDLSGDIEGTGWGFAKHSSEAGFFLLANGTDYLLLSDGTSKMILNQVQSVTFSDADYYAVEPPLISYGKQVVDRAIVRTYPRKLAAAATTVLWTMENSLSLTPGQTRTDIVGTYRDANAGEQKINGTDFVTPVATTDYQAFANSDGTGANLTANLSVTAAFGAAEVEITITNTGGTTLYTGGDILFQVRGRGVYVYDKADFIDEDATSISTYGKKELVIDWKYEDVSSSSANLLAGGIVTSADFKTPKTLLERVTFLANSSTKNMMVWMGVEPFFLLTFSDTMSGVSSGQYYVQGINFEIRENNIIKYTLGLSKYFLIIDF